jgi:hypothetical protein
MAKRQQGQIVETPSEARQGQPGPLSVNEVAETRKVPSEAAKWLLKRKRRGWVPNKVGRGPKLLPPAARLVFSERLTGQT